MELEQLFRHGKRNRALAQQLHGRLRQPQQPHVICHRLARQSNALANLRLCQLELLAQHAKRFRLLQRAQILALQVFDDRHFRRLLIGDLADQRGDG